MADLGPTKVYGDLQVTGGITGTVTGNADTATKLQTARTIGGVAFDGTANINLPGVNTAGNQNTTGNAATATKLETARTIGGVSFDGTANINLPGVNTAGNQNTTGNAATATKLATARTLSITGDATGSMSFDGSSNASAPLTLANSGVTAGTYKSVTVDAKGRVTAGTEVVVGLVTAATATGTANVATSNTDTFLNVTEKVGAAVASAGTSTQIQGAGTVTVASDTAGKITITGAQSITGNAATATRLATARTIGGVSFDGTANINLPGVNAAGNQNTTGNAATATKLQTARTIGGVSFDGSANINLPGVNTAGNQDTAGNAATATKLATARTIGGVSFDGSADVDLPGVNTAGSQSTSGNAATATKLATARTINGVAFDGTANITVTATDPNSVTKAGDTMSGNLTMADSAQVRLGTDADLRLYHNGSHSYIDQNGTGNLYIRNNVTGGTILFYADNTGGTSQLVAQLGVGTDNAAYLYAAGATKLNTTAAGVAVTGTLIASSNITAYSDIRLKANIQVIPDALSKIAELRGVTYDRIDCDNERQTGLVAQEVQAVLPEAVRDDGEHLSVAYGNVVGLLVEAIKELNAKVDELRRAA